MKTFAAKNESVKGNNPAGKNALPLEDNRKQITADKKTNHAAEPVVQAKLKIERSSIPEFTELKFGQFKSLKKRYDMTVDAWKILRKMASSDVVFTYSTWGHAINKAQELHNVHPDGFNQWIKYLRSGKNNERITIRQPGYATGDQFGIAAALIMDPNMDVVISSGPGPGKPGHDPTDKSISIRDFYIESGIAPWRIKLAGTNNVRDSGNQAMRDQVIDTYKKDFDVSLTKTQAQNHRSKPVNHGLPKNGVMQTGIK